MHQTLALSAGVSQGLSPRSECHVRQVLEYDGVGGEERLEELLEEERTNVI